MMTDSNLDVQIRDVSELDFPAILALNTSAEPQVSRLDLDKLQWLAATAAYFRVAEVTGIVVGFLIAVAHDSPYKSVYFQWFADRFSNFIYIDRVIVTEWAQGRRIAWRLFEDTERFAVASSNSLASDVYSKPPNEVSLAFHRKYGFGLVGTQAVENGAKEVAKLWRPL